MGTRATVRVYVEPSDDYRAKWSALKACVLAEVVPSEQLLDYFGLDECVDLNDLPGMSYRKLTLERSIHDRRYEQHTILPTDLPEGWTKILVTLE